MTAFLPRRPGSGVEQDHPRLHQKPLSPAEQRARWEVRAAQWRARALAEAVFGRVGDMGLTGIRGKGPLRGLLRLDVPFEGLELHRARESRFLAAVESDPLLASVPLVYVFGPHGV
ncbi:MAG: hypothetical protein OEN56_09205 [Gemmatimonadota bacterium]|nr:hypothetical protein [Gemmatimonadota bacterium]